MKRKYYRYTNLYMLYLKALHEGHAYYPMNFDGEYIMPLKSAIPFGSWCVINYVKLHYGIEAVNHNLSKSFKPCIDEILEE